MEYRLKGVRLSLGFWEKFRISVRFRVGGKDRSTIYCIIDFFPNEGNCAT